MDVVIAAKDIVFGQQGVKQRHGVFHAIHNQFAKSAVQAGKGFWAVAAMNDQLGNQAVLIGRNFVTVIKRGIHPYA
jgi:hypothetical protein